MKNIIEALKQLHKSALGHTVKQSEELPLSGSDRIYHRLWNDKNSVIGVFNADLKENEAFFSFTNTFRKIGVNTPEIIAISDDRQCYLLSDLGDTTLFKHISENKNKIQSKKPLCYIKLSLKALLKIQLEGAKHIDFAKCYPRNAFDKQSIVWDLNYFKYLFLKPTGIKFDEQLLENDFEALSEYLLCAPSDYFMYRDFQSRNIMIKNNETWFIDYQGGRRGPLQYDLASLLYSPKTQLNPVQRDIFLKFYIDELKKYQQIDRLEFTKQYYAFVLIRILQALGAYGFRGLIEHKPGFIQHIPQAISNLHTLFRKKLIPIHLPEIEKLSALLFKSKMNEIQNTDSNKLTVHVKSFSYKKGIPHDENDNGGGFVFDCRGLPNPGRQKEYRAYNGTQQIIIDYLEQYSQVHEFQELAQKMLSVSIHEYMERKFTHLCVNFGCTGGQHRSVYNAEVFSHWLENNFDVNVVLHHIELEKKKNEQNPM